MLRMAFIGVRISWLMLARKALFARLAASAVFGFHPARPFADSTSAAMVAVMRELFFGALAFGNVPQLGDRIGGCQKSP